MSRQTVTTDCSRNVFRFFLPSFLLSIHSPFTHSHNFLRLHVTHYLHQNFSAQLIWSLETQILFFQTAHSTLLSRSPPSLWYIAFHSTHLFPFPRISGYTCITNSISDLIFFLLHSLHAWLLSHFLHSPPPLLCADSLSSFLPRNEGWIFSLSLSPFRVESIDPITGIWRTRLFVMCVQTSKHVYEVSSKRVFCYLSPVPRSSLSLSDPFYSSLHLSLHVEQCSKAILTGARSKLSFNQMKKHVTKLVVVLSTQMIEATDLMMPLSSVPLSRSLDRCEEGGWIPG